MKLWTDQYDLSVGYPDGSLVGTQANKTQMEWDSNGNGTQLMYLL